MRKAFLIAALMITTSVGVAHAGDSFSFQINGQKVRIERPHNCTSLSCLNIVAPGLTNSSSDDSSPSTASSNNDATNTNTTSNTAAPVAPQTNSVTAAPVAPVTTPAPVQQQAPVTASNTYAPLVATVPQLPGESNNNTNITALPGQTSNVTTLPAPQPQPQVQQNVEAPAPQPNVYAPAPAQQTAALQPQVQQVQQPAQQVLGGPLGMWMTEKNEGKVHIVNCGGNVCGYAVNDRTGADGEQVLINMTPEGDSWHGKIHDTRSGGTYDSTIAMRGSDKMRVQGCAFGGMFCGGQTWSRVN